MQFREATGTKEKVSKRLFLKKKVIQGQKRATTILLFNLVKTYDCQFLLSMEVLQFLRQLLTFHTTKEKYQKDYF